jgi:hypothetical protein
LARLDKLFEDSLIISQAVKIDEVHCDRKIVPRWWQPCVVPNF